MEKYFFNSYHVSISKKPNPFKRFKLSKEERFKSFSVKFLENNLFVHDSDSYNLGVQEIYINEAYKFYTTRKDPIIIDCGSNIGMSVIYFKHKYPEAKIFAFEADPKIFEFLRKNVTSFAFKDVTLFNKAVWESEELLEFYSEYGAGGRLESSIIDTGVVKEKYEVRGYMLSKLINDLSYVDFLKIDIEGAELEVLKNIEQFLYKVDNLFIEYHSFKSRNQNLDEILQIMTENGFKYYIKNTVENRYPFIDRMNIAGMDLQLEIYAYK